MGPDSRRYEMTLSVYETDHFKMMEDVANRIMTGKSELAVARSLGIKRVEVLAYLEEWNQLLRQTDASDLAMDYVNRMVKHYDRLIEESYQLLDDLKELSFNHQVAAQIDKVLNSISNYEKARVDVLQKTGILDGSDIGEELVQMEEQQKALIAILRNDLCKECQKVVARKLSSITGEVEAVQVHEEFVPHEHN